ncbi:MAG: hypothetical protein H6558_07230 [Lewinellaceae bacterium]|nr:hypothetical protein [Lewinellaceae bacterium]MCB9286360.1 hypothetical protein [Lewinellaceae bacterium]
MAPCILLAYADTNRDLPQLKQEMEAINRILVPLENRGFIKIEKLFGASHEDISSILSAYSERLIIFHYGGHANGEEILLEETRGQGAGLAQLLGDCPRLELVFLNGCATVGHVRRLFDAKVNTVIGTSALVADKRAMEFALGFYQGLVNRRTLKRAFDFAQGVLALKAKKPPACFIHRGISLENTAKGGPEEWGLYVREEASSSGKSSEHLNWRLPYFREFSLPTQIVRHIGNFKANRHIASVLSEMCRYNKDIYTQMVQVKDGVEVPLDSSRYLELVIENFPWVVGSQIQLLRQRRQAGPLRMQQLLCTYLRVTQTLFFILLSDLWENIHAGAEVETKGLLGTLRVNGEGNCRHFDYVEGMLEVYRRMKAAEFPFFVPELESLCERFATTDSPLKLVHTYFQGLRSSEAVPSTEGDCEEAEKRLALLLRRAAFLSNYSMLTVREIQVQQPRFKNKQYDLEHGLLNGQTGSSLAIYEDPRYRLKNSYAHSHSVILAYREEDLSEFLNLSPFIIDVNTFLQNPTPDLYLYGFEKDGHFHYLKADHDHFTALDNQNGMDIMDTSLTFRQYEEGENDRQKQQLQAIADPYDFFEYHQLAAVEESPKVFALLAEQFELFLSDFTPRNTGRSQND